MRSILLKGRNSAPNSEINSGNRFNKTKSNKHNLQGLFHAKVNPLQGITWMSL